MTSRLASGARGERGAILIQAAVSMVVLLGFSSFVVDFGILWLSREQAQNAADAGAMAGAIASGYDGAAIVAPSASQMVAANPVWFSNATSQVVQGACPADAVGFDCIRVNVYRDGTAGSTPLPMLFGPVLGLTTQGVRATATAQLAVGEGTPCLKPWAIPDRWLERRPVPKAWGPGDVFQRYKETPPGAGALLVPADLYTAPSPGGPGTGFTTPVDMGAPATLTIKDGVTSDPITTDFMLPLDLPGATTYSQDITGCNGLFRRIGEYLPTDLGATTIATTAAIAALIAADPVASWVGGTNRIQGSCAPACASISPRLIALAIFDPDEYQLMRATGAFCPGMAACVQVVNIVGFFIEQATAAGAQGYLTKYPGLIASVPPIPPVSSFLPAVTLIR
jgi:Flp pilus assembly protein TadG